MDGDIETSGDFDYFSFRAQPDTRYTIETALRSNEDTELKLYGEDGELIAEDDDGGSGYASRIEWTARASGLYYAEVSGHSGATRLLPLCAEKGVEYIDAPGIGHLGGSAVVQVQEERARVELRRG